MIARPKLTQTIHQSLFLWTCQSNVLYCEVPAPISHPSFVLRPSSSVVSLPSSVWIRGRAVFARLGRFLDRCQIRYLSSRQRCAPHRYVRQPAMPDKLGCFVSRSDYSTQRLQDIRPNSQTCHVCSNLNTIGVASYYVTTLAPIHCQMQPGY